MVDVQLIWPEGEPSIISVEFVPTLDLMLKQEEERLRESSQNHFAFMQREKLILHTRTKSHHSSF